MKYILKFGKFLPVFLLLIWSCQPEEENILETDPIEQEVESFIQDAEELLLNVNSRIAVEDYNLCQDPIQYALRAWPNNDVGTVEISNTADYLVVSYETNDEFSFSKTTLLIIVEKTSNYGKYHKKYKKYVFPIRHDKGTKEYTYEIPLSEIDLNGDEITIAASAHIAKNDDNKYGWGKFAIATEDYPNKKCFYKNWLIDYTLAACSIEEECEVSCTSGFLTGDTPPYLKSFYFSDSQLKIDDWAWGKALQFSNFNTNFVNLVLILDEAGEMLGSANALIKNVNGQTTIRVTMPENLVIKKSSVYFSTEAPTSGIPCNYGFENVYVDGDGNGEPTSFDEYVFQHDGGDFWIIYHADVCDINISF